MSDLASSGARKTYLNPVYPKSFPDPFVLKHDGRYYGYSTDFAADGKVFGVITSRDLVTWTDVGGAMTPLDPSPPFYWAPEVNFSEGKFYLYYSVGNETLMELRVAVSERPDGGFVDSGHRLTREEFAIDAHVFIDDDGSKYLFYATDFLQHTHIGTGTVVDRMIDWFTLAGEPRPVTRAKYDWQVYDPQRKEKGGVRWHTVEGPAVLKRKGIYYEMFSGGNWQNTTYGVSFATSDDINSSEEWNQFSDGANILPILRTEPGVIIGPGHNSVVRGLNNRELYCVYHRWTDAGRVLAIDRMDFAGNRIFVTGATHTPQLMPFAPTIDGIGAARISASEGWIIADGGVGSDATGSTELRLEDLPSSFLLEFTFRCGNPHTAAAQIGITFSNGADDVTLALHPNSNELSLTSAGQISIHKLAPEFDWDSSHLMRTEIDYRKLTFKLGDVRLDDITLPGGHVNALRLSSKDAAFEISSFQLTEGFEELFEDTMPLDENGWSVTGDANQRLDTGELIVEAASAFEITKHRPLRSLEVAANFRTTGPIGDDGGFGLVLRADQKELLLFVFDIGSSSMIVNGETVEHLPPNLSFDSHRQLRVIKDGREALCYLDEVLVKTVKINDAAASAFILCDRVSVGIEAIRLTSI